MEIILNKEKISTSATNLGQLIEDKVVEKTGIAVAVGLKVVPRSEWNDTPLNEGDVITVIKATRGG